jgi:hypothetical protein
LNLKSLDSNDSTWVKDLIASTYAAPLSDQSIKQTLDDSSLTIGDSNIPIYLRVVYYNLVSSQADLMPKGIVTGMCTQIADLQSPLGTSFEKIIIPTLAEGLGQMIEKIPEAAKQQVWAFLDPDTVAFLQKNFFPTAWIDGGYIGHLTLQDAFNEIAKWRPSG